MSSHADLKALFLPDPDVVFLNHGSYGACRSGGNVTGFELGDIELGGKRLQLLKDAVPTQADRTASSLPLEDGFVVFDGHAVQL